MLFVLSLMGMLILFFRSLVALALLSSHFSVCRIVLFVCFVSRSVSAMSRVRRPGVVEDLERRGNYHGAGTGLEPDVDRARPEDLRHPGAHSPPHAPPRQPQDHRRKGQRPEPRAPAAVPVAAPARRKHRRRTPCGRASLACRVLGIRSRRVRRRRRPRGAKEIGVWWWWGRRRRRRT